ncbi:MAG: hypothetical protein ACT4NX_04240 [Deltaproteobacteria bacterium]
MNLAFVEKIASAVLYEGYILYPYTPSSVKNRQRWTFGGIYPRSYSESGGGFDAWTMQTECLAVADENSPVAPRFELRVRFLHVVERKIGEMENPASALDPEPAFKIVGSLRVGDKNYLGWQEAAEREVIVENLDLAQLANAPQNFPFSFASSRSLEPIKSPAGSIAGIIVRESEAIEGMIEISSERLAPEVYKIRARILNLTSTGGGSQSRNDALGRSFVSTHAVFGIEGGRFISLIDPPTEFQKFASECGNIGNFPVLVSGEGENDALLASPIILYDYPQIAPESAGDLFDATEIDEILTLRILTLSEEEKNEIRSFDDKARLLLERAESITREEMMKLHGTMRDIRPLAAEDSAPEPQDGWDNSDGITGWNPLEEKPSSVVVAGVELKPGARVVLKPAGRGDVFDVALVGKTAIIESIEQDYEDRLYLVVTVEDDPGRDFDMKKMPGHRFFFSPEEVCPLVGEGVPYEDTARETLGAASGREG